MSNGWLFQIYNVLSLCLNLGQPIFIRTLEVYGYLEYQPRSHSSWLSISSCLCSVCSCSLPSICISKSIPQWTVCDFLSQSLFPRNPIQGFSMLFTDKPSSLHILWIHHQPSNSGRRATGEQGTGLHHRNRTVSSHVCIAIKDFPHKMIDTRFLKDSNSTQGKTKINQQDNHSLRRDS